MTTSHSEQDSRGGEKQPGAAQPPRQVELSASPAQAAPTDERDVDEYDVRQWFKTVDIEQARDTFRVVEGILEMRGTQRRKRRKDAGAKRGPSQQQIISAVNEEGQ